MKVILLEDIPGSGKKDQILQVSDGYARNYLIPKKLAREATADALNSIERAKSAEKHRETKRRQEAQELAAKLSKGVVTVTARAGDKSDHLYGSVTAEQVADALAQQFHISIEKRRITLPEAIRKLGEFQITVWLYAGVEATMTLRVVTKA
ncbi:MAG: 50S ribosomal protein L9 [Oscillospiraceae bacterium]|jgi:large subunit ribosomal protein L9|nr:50S ribosomal protein L9 [Oscillospiraceae bacterium]